MIHLLEPETLKKWITANQVSIIDVREQSEYNQSNIEGAILMPVATVTFSKIKEIAQNGKKIVIHCKSGGRSLRVCQMLMEYDNELDVYNLEGGITAWKLLK
jgi:rhodanese-related sulfurtransferase